MSVPRLRVRTRLLLTIVGALALGLAIALGAFWLLLAQRLSASATSLARAQARAEASSVQVRGGRLVLPARPTVRTAGQTWLFSGSEALASPRASAELRRAARSLAGGPERSLDVSETRLYAIPVSRNGVRYGTVVSATSLDAYEETTHTTAVSGAVLALVLLAIVAALSWWILGRVLRPVQQMTEDAADWSEHDLDRRFDLGEPYDELTGLAATLDNLLGRVAGSLRREQRFAAELSHELRTPLARVRGEAELTLAKERGADEYRAALAAVLRYAEQMTGTVEALVAQARHEADRSLRSSDVRAPVEATVESARASRPDLRITSTLPHGPLHVSADGELVAAMLQPVVENASAYARSTVGIAVRRAGSSVVVDVLDDGPGVTVDERERIFEPGVRGSASEDRSGAGLGLSLARRLARSAGGDVSAEPSDAGGRFTLRLPLAG